MAPQTPMQSFPPLRVITQRISSTPSQQLPHIAPYLATSISNCGKILAFEKGVQNGDGAEPSVLVHKLKTQLSALLQDKSPHARYSAVILIKATVEVGGWNILNSAGPWVRGLIGILSRPDPTGTKKLCIITLTRIFILTQEHQSLVREITTPSLAGFVASCLNIVKLSASAPAQSPLLLVVLQVLIELITLHPTSFRPFVPQIQTLTLPLIAPTPSNSTTGGKCLSVLGPVTENARRLFVLLHVCGPKGTAGEEWVKSLQTILTSTQKTADRVFRALVEDWRPPRERIDGLQATSYSEVVSDQRSVPLALLGWTGIYAGVERLDGLLHTVKAFIASITSAPVVLLMSNIMNLVDRVLSALQPNSAKSSRNRPEISRDEREGLFAALPQLHVTAMGILSRVILRLDHGFAATSHIALDEIFWVLDNESHDDKIRKAAYEVVSQILRLFGPSLPRPHATSLSRCIKLACADLLPSAEISSQEGEAFVPNGKKSVNGARSSNADSYLKTAETRSQVPSGSADVVEAARRLLPLTLTNLPSGFLSYATRCQIDRTAILTNDKEAMLASIMNPPISAKGQKTASSIIPLLARAYPEAPEVEALLRPQMPMLQSRCRNGETTASDEEEDLYQQISRTKSDLDVTYGDNSGLNGGTNVERNVADHESADKQVFTGIKGIEQLVEATDLSSRFAVSYVPGKRDREDDLDLEAREDKGTAATSGSVEIKDVESPSKKVRLIYSTTTAVEGLKSTPPAIQVDKNLEETAFVPSTTTPTAAGALGTRYDEGQGDSDESDFVMPTLNLEPDTDEEEGDEDEDDG